MTNNKVKTKAEMLLELESIKGLLLEDDDIPLLQESIGGEPYFTTDAPIKTTAAEALPREMLAREISALEAFAKAQVEQQDFFNALPSDSHATSFTRAPLAKATGENPFLPAHIRTRLHGNNPPAETAKKISSMNQPITQLGKTQHYTTPATPTPHQQELINAIVASILPHIEKELRERLAVMSKEMLSMLLAN
jgi:hypothetical protein